LLLYFETPAKRYLFTSDRVGGQWSGFASRILKAEVPGKDSEIREYPRDINLPRIMDTSVHPVPALPGYLSLGGAEVKAEKIHPSVFTCGGREAFQYSASILSNTGLPVCDGAYPENTRAHD